MRRRRPRSIARWFAALAAWGVVPACGRDPDDDVTFSGPSTLAGSLDPTYGGRPLEDWLRDLGASDPAVRYAALTAMPELVGAEAHHARIERLTTDGVPAVRAAALEALGRLGDGSSAGAVVTGLDDADAGVRRAAARAAAWLGSPAVHGLLLRYDTAEDDRRALCKRALVAIGEGLAPHALELSRRLFGDDATATEDAADLLAVTGPAGVTVLAGAAADARPFVAVTAIATLARLGKGATAALAAIEAQLARRGDVRSTALDALANMGDAGRAALERAGASPDEDLARAARERLASPPK